MQYCKNLEFKTANFEKFIDKFNQALKKIEFDFSKLEITINENLKEIKSINFEDFIENLKISTFKIDLNPNTTTLLSNIKDNSNDIKDSLEKIEKKISKGLNLGNSGSNKGLPSISSIPEAVIEVINSVMFNSYYENLERSLARTTLKNFDESFINSFQTLDKITRELSKKITVDVLEIPDLLGNLSDNGFSKDPQNKKLSKSKQKEDNAQYLKDSAILASKINIFGDIDLDMAIKIMKSFKDIFKVKGIDELENSFKRLDSFSKEFDIKFNNSLEVAQKSIDKITNLDISQNDYLALCAFYTKTSKDSKEATFLLNSVLDGFNDLAKNPNIVEHFKDLKIDFDVKNPFESFNDILSLNFDTNLVNEQLRKIFSENALKSLNIIKDNANIYNKITKLNPINTSKTFEKEYREITNGSTGLNIFNNNKLALNKINLNPSNKTNIDLQKEKIWGNSQYKNSYGQKYEPTNSSLENKEDKILTSLEPLNQLKNNYEVEKNILEELKKLNENILSLKISDEKYYVQNFSLTKDDLENFQKCTKADIWSYKKFMDKENI